jgi:uncharacterized membrane protein YbhN (UPF0104 family)
MNKGRSLRVLRLTLGLASLAALLAFSSPLEVGRTLLRADLLYVLIATVLYTTVMAVRVIRWKYVLSDLKIEMPFWTLFRMSLVGTYFNTFSPAGIGSDVYRAYGVAQLSEKKLRPVAAILIERLTGIISLTTVCLVAIIVHWGKLQISSGLLAMVAGSIMAVAAGGLMAIGNAGGLERLAKRILPARLARRLSWHSWAPVALDIRTNRIMMARTYAIGLVLTGLVLACYWSIGRAIAPHLGPVLVAIFFPIIDLATMIPVTINGLGLKEALAVVFLEQVGLLAQFSLSLSILYRVIDLGHALVGGLLFFTRTRKPVEALRAA